VTQIGCSSFHRTKFEQVVIHQHVLLRRESLFDGTAVAII
jgi:hypothetical protein